MGYAAMTIADLIRRLEAAMGPDRELDAALCPHKTKRSPYHNGEWLYQLPDDPRAWNYLPHYTGSIDAALTLVPDGKWDGQIMWNFGELQRGGFVELNLANPEWLKPDCDPSQLNAHAACVSSYDNEDGSRSDVQLAARPLAIAICIAALKARAATMGDDADNKKPPALRGTGAVQG